MAAPVESIHCCFVSGQQSHLSTLTHLLSPARPTLGADSLRPILGADSLPIGDKLKQAVEEALVDFVSTEGPCSQLQKISSSFYPFPRSQACKS